MIVNVSNEIGIIGMGCPEVNACIECLQSGLSRIIVGGFVITTVILCGKLQINRYQESKGCTSSAISDDG